MRIRIRNQKGYYMKFKPLAIAFAVILTSVGCSSDSLFTKSDTLITENSKLEKTLEPATLDSTIFVPSRYLQETPQSRMVRTGASQLALSRGCMFMQRYRIAINADFTGTLNLMKYRASGMGSEWINVQFHAEATPYDRVEKYGASVFLVDGTMTRENQIYTVMEADLFDCGCNELECD